MANALKNTKKFNKKHPDEWRRKPGLRRKEQLLARRAKVADLRMAGAKLQEIADILDVSVGTVHNDLKVLRKQWAESSIDNIEALVALDIERTEAAIRAIWFDVTKGSLKHIQMLDRLLNTRSKILGYESASKRRGMDDDSDTGYKMPQFVTNIIVARPSDVGETIHSIDHDGELRSLPPKTEVGDGEVIDVEAVAVDSEEEED